MFCGLQKVQLAARKSRGLSVILIVSAAGCGAPLVDPARSVSSDPRGGIVAPPASQGAAQGGPIERVPLSRVLPHSNTKAKSTYHEVKAGETLAGLAAKYRVSVERLVEANGLDSAGPLQAGQLIYIPTGPSLP